MNTPSVLNVVTWFWAVDPLPIPPAVPPDSMDWWRWASKVALEARKERAR